MPQKHFNIAGPCNSKQHYMLDPLRSIGKELVNLIEQEHYFVIHAARQSGKTTLLKELVDKINAEGKRNGTPFIHSIALVGMRNIRDYKARIRPDSETLGSSSPFNIVKESLTLENFTKEDVRELYAQHTAATGQIFEKTAVEFIFEQTQGQPWLVNAIACECVEKIFKYDYSAVITQDIAKQAIQNLILARGTHFDSLMERLKEERVRNVIQPLILGDSMAVDRASDDYLYTRDLGLIREAGSGIVEPANKIYAEIIIRQLNYTMQETLKVERPSDELPKYIVKGKININALLKDFQAFWRENSEIWTTKYKKNFYQYDDAAPHLVIQAFLQRVLNGGGHISREMALGTNRADICVEWEEQKYPIELKLYQSAKTVKDATVQILKYMDRVGSKEGWVVIFDRTPKKSWSKKLYVKEVKPAAGKKITIFGC